MVGCLVLEFRGEIRTGGRHLEVTGGSHGYTGMMEIAQRKEEEKREEISTDI